MKFHLAINLERMSASEDMEAIQRHVLEMVQMADRAGFEIVWAAEHHALEMTIAPNPFQILTWWAGETDRIRLGTGVVNAAYWHPIGLAGEAAFLDLISGGRLEFGIGSGAYQREFDRMRPGVLQTDGWRYLQEMLPAVRALWAGDYAHQGEFWQFPSATSCPKPIQPEVPVWVAARAPVTFDYGVGQDCHLMSWPLTLPDSEITEYGARLETAKQNHNPDWARSWALMRHSSVYATQDDADAAMAAIRGVLGQFGNLMLKKGDVINGFPERVPLAELDGNVRVDPEMLERNLMFGSPETVIGKLQSYAEAGIDSFIYYASMGLDRERQKRSLRLFCDEVMPAFR